MQADKAKKTKRVWGDLIGLGVIIVAVSLILHILLAWINPRDIFTDCRRQNNRIGWLEDDKRSLRNEIKSGKIISDGLLLIIKQHEKDITGVQLKKYMETKSE